MTERVPYGDLSLNTKDGRNVLVRRVGYAVDRVCPDTGYYSASACKNDAWRDAWPQMRTAFRLAQSGEAASLTAAIEITSISGK